MKSSIKFLKDSNSEKYLLNNPVVLFHDLIITKNKNKNEVDGNNNNTSINNSTSIDSVNGNTNVTRTSVLSTNRDMTNNFSKLKISERPQTTSSMNPRSRIRIK